MNGNNSYRNRNAFGTLADALPALDTVRNSAPVQLREFARRDRIVRALAADALRKVHRFNATEHARVASYVDRTAAQAAGAQRAHDYIAACTTFPTFSERDLVNIFIEALLEA
jgi:hypothetical protein